LEIEEAVEFLFDFKERFNAEKGVLIGVNVNVGTDVGNAVDEKPVKYLASAFFVVLLVDEIAGLVFPEAPAFFKGGRAVPLRNAGGKSTKEVSMWFGECRGDEATVGVEVVVIVEDGRVALAGGGDAVDGTIANFDIDTVVGIELGCTHRCAVGYDIVGHQQ
jgi:hypothetical protein